MSSRGTSPPTVPSAKEFMSNLKRFHEAQMELGWTTKEKVGSSSSSSSSSSGSSSSRSNRNCDDDDSR